MLTDTLTVLSNFYFLETVMTPDALRSVSFQPVKFYTDLRIKQTSSHEFVRSVKPRESGYKLPLEADAFEIFEAYGAAHFSRENREHPTKY